MLPEEFLVDPNHLHQCSVARFHVAVDELQRPDVDTLEQLQHVRVSCTEADEQVVPALFRVRAQEFDVLLGTGKPLLAADRHCERGIEQNIVAYPVLVDVAVKDYYFVVKLQVFINRIHNRDGVARPHRSIHQLSPPHHATVKLENLPFRSPLAVET